MIIVGFFNLNFEEKGIIIYYYLKYILSKFYILNWSIVCEMDGNFFWFMFILGFWFTFCFFLLMNVLV